jgi:hypothetical protein
MMLKYKPAGFTIQAIPARDLTDEEVEQWGEDYLTATGLYVREEVNEEQPIHAELEPQEETKTPKRKRAKGR